MSRLLVAELRRVAARRLVRVVVVLAGLGIVGGGVLAFVSTGALSESAYQERVRVAEARREAVDAEIEQCLEDAGASGVGEVPDEVARRCFPEEPPPEADDPRYDRRALRGVLQGVSGVLAIAGWALGASLIGAEYASRGLTTLLTFEPRRTRVFVAKVGAVLVASAALALAVLVGVTVALVPTLALHGTPLEGGDPSVASLAGTVGRGVALAALAAGVGFALASLGRNTAAALGAGFAYIIVFENILGSSTERWRRWLLLGNTIVFVSGNDDGGEVPGRTVTGAGLFLAAVTLTVLVAAAGAFRTRDVT